MNRLSRVFLIPLTTLVCTKILILSLFYEQYPHQFQRSSNNNKKEAGNLRDNRPLIVSEMRFELTRANAHYPLKVACLPFHHICEKWRAQQESNPQYQNRNLM